MRVAAAVAAWGWWVGTCVMSCDNIFKFEGRGCSAYELQHEFGTMCNIDIVMRSLRLRESEGFEKLTILDPKIPRIQDSEKPKIPRSHHFPGLARTMFFEVRCPIL